MTSGLLVGILLSRTVSGLVGAHLGWRAMYLIAAAATLLLALALRIFLPRQEPALRLSYPRLLRSLPRLLREPLLRRHAILGALALAAFSAFWTTLTFLLEAPPFRLGSSAAGAFGIVGVAGALAAPFAGRLADRIGTRAVNGLALLLVLLSYCVFAASARSLVLLGVGVVLLDLGVQANHISNQTRILGLSADARNRLNSVYVAIYFTGAAAGSALASSRMRRGAGRASRRWASGLRSSRWWRSSRSRPRRRKPRTRRPPDGATLRPSVPSGRHGCTKATEGALADDATITVSVGHFDSRKRERHQRVSEFGAEPAG